MNRARYRCLSRGEAVKPPQKNGCLSIPGMSQKTAFNFVRKRGRQVRYSHQHPSDPYISGQSGQSVRTYQARTLSTLQDPLGDVA